MKKSEDLPPPMELTNQIASRISVEPTLTKRIDALRAHAPMIDNALRFTINHGAPPSITFDLLDGAKSILSRDLLLRRRASASGLFVGDRLLGVGHNLQPGYSAQLFEREPDLCIISFLQTLDRRFYAFVLLSESGQHKIAQIEIATGSHGVELFEELLALQSSRLWKDDDRTFRSLSNLLKLVGDQIIPKLIRLSPRRIVVIPHKLFHLLPLHLIYTADDRVRDGSWKYVYLHDIATQLIYSSSAAHYMNRRRYSVTRAAQQEAKAEKQKAFLACVDTSALFSGAALERDRYYAMAGDLGHEEARVITKGALSSEVPGFLVVALSCHARSDPLDWRNSFVSFDGRQTSAEEIVAYWDMTATQVALLLACESGTDRGVSEAVDEYMGLDSAVHIAGAQSVVSTMWRVDDSAAALVGMFVVERVFDGVPASKALGEATKLMRDGHWRASVEASYRDLQRATQIDPKRREFNLRLLERELRVDFDRLQEVRHWGCFRCFGGW
jgi:CHAT domain-containing protein